MKATSSLEASLACENNFSWRRETPRSRVLDFGTTASHSVLHTHSEDCKEISRFRLPSWSRRRLLLKVPKLTMPTDGKQAGANAGVTDRITQLKPPAQLDSDTTNLADTWIKMDARIRVIHGFGNERQDKATKVEMFLYFCIYLAVKGGKFMIRWPSKFLRRKEL